MNLNFSKFFTCENPDRRFIYSEDLSCIWFVSDNNLRSYRDLLVHNLPLGLKHAFLIHLFTFNLKHPCYNREKTRKRRDEFMQRSPWNYPIFKGVVAKTWCNQISTPMAGAYANSSHPYFDYFLNAPRPLRVKRRIP